MVVPGLVLGVYGLFAAVAAGNAFLMRRPRPVAGAALPAVLIPARNEEENLKRLVPLLIAQGAKVYVYDDDSEDGTSEAARSAGAVVLRGGALPEGWIGKSHACHRLALAASEDFDGEWVVFLDADVHPGPDFLASLGGWIAGFGRTTPVATGFPKFEPGAGIEPGYLSWMTWILLCTNPFGLTARTGLGHNLFTNGQVTLWRLTAYMEHLPHEAVKSRVLEDVAIGRLLARRKVRVETLNLSRHLSVSMYPDVRRAWNGMVKNSVEIAGRGLGSLLLAGFLGLTALAWAGLPSPYWWIAGLLLLLSRAFSNVVTEHPWWVVPATPISLLAGGFTVLESMLARRWGRAVWKGRKIS
ncbi:MAG: glycosyltransferase family 2 protein [Fimbriimonadaceae bacterium]|nr:glycosyltransferase family 2 protein [Fimbriimonadaceae bacterium]